RCGGRVAFPLSLCINHSFSRIGMPKHRWRRPCLYAELNCQDDMTTFLKSGFQPVSTTRTQKTPLSQWFRKIVAGKNSGQMEVSLMTQPDALSYQLHWAVLGTGGTPIRK